MSKTQASLSIIVFSILVFYSFLSAQQDTTKYPIIRVELKDGSILIGKILSEDESAIQMKTLSNIEVIIQKQQIKRKENVSGQMVEGILWGNDPNRTRLLFAPTGRALKAGQGYFSTYEILFPFLAVGITDFLTIAGGISLVPGAENQLLYLAPKITPVQVDKFDLSGGVLYIRIPDEENAAGIVYGVGTYGTEKSALTLGLGYGFAGGEFADNPIFAIGGELRASKSVKFITENWIFPGEEVHLLSGGLRFFGENLSADFAFIFPAGSDMEGFPFIPWIGFVYNFGTD